MSRKRKKIKLNTIPQLTEKKIATTPVKIPNRFIKFFSTGFDIKALLQILAICIAITGICVAIWIFGRKEEGEKSEFSVQMGIQPTSDIDSNGRHFYYQSWYMFRNTGKTIIKTANISWLLNLSKVEFNDMPFLIGSNHGVEINIVRTSTPDFREINIKNCPPNVGFFIGINHRIKQEFVNDVYQVWKESMFDSKFTNIFISELAVSGEKITLKNDGFYDLEKLRRE